MYFFISAEKLMLGENVIGIFDTDTATVSPVTRKTLRMAEANGRMESVTKEIPKSLVLTDEADGGKIYMSQLSPKILKKRAMKGIM